MRIGADVPADTAEGTALGNTASVSSATTELDPSDDTASVSTTVETTADLAITKSASPDPAQAGLPLVYTLTISNAGPADAASVSLADVLPVALTGATYCTGSGCDPSGGPAWSQPPRPGHAGRRGDGRRAHRGGCPGRHGRGHDARQHGLGQQRHDRARPER